MRCAALATSAAPKKLVGNARLGPSSAICGRSAGAAAGGTSRRELEVDEKTHRLFQTKYEVTDIRPENVREGLVEADD
jgi:hypothetical protein